MPSLVNICRGIRRAIGRGNGKIVRFQGRSRRETRTRPNLVNENVKAYVRLTKEEATVRQFVSSCSVLRRPFVLTGRVSISDLLSRIYIYIYIYCSLFSSFINANPQDRTTYDKTILRKAAESMVERTLFVDRSELRTNRFRNRTAVQILAIATESISLEWPGCTKIS